MGRTLVVTDSSACLQPRPGEGADLRVVPIAIHFGDTTYHDADIDPEAVLGAMEAEEPVKSTAPSLVDYLNAAEGGDYDGAVVLTPAAEFTQMYRNASRAAELSTREVVVVDTRTAAVSQGLVVRAALRAAGEGLDATGVAARAAEVSARAELLAATMATGPIERSGRIPAGTLASVSNPPLFRFRDGTVAVVEEPGDPLVALEEAWRRGDGPRAATSTVFHAGGAAAASELRDRLGVANPIVRFSPAMAIHTGPGLVGVAWIRP